MSAPAESRDCQPVADECLSGDAALSSAGPTAAGAASLSTNERVSDGDGKPAATPDTATADTCHLGGEASDPLSVSDNDCDSDESDISNISGLNWKSTSGSLCWVQEQIGSGVDPRHVLRRIRPDIAHIPAHVDNITLWKIVIDILSEPPRREKLRHVNTLSDLVRLLRGSSRVLVLTGAGISVSCGIPDFRSRDGIYSRLTADFPDLPDPQAMFDINYFRKNPRPFFKFAKEIYPGQFKPSLSHRLIAMLDRQGKLLRNYTQNIDTLEQSAGIGRVIQCHGSFATASCLRCGLRVDSEQIRPAIEEQRLPLCPRCSPPLATGQEGSCASSESSPLQPIMKPDIVFFGEGLPDEFHKSMESDSQLCDLLIIIGSSLKVRPVALIPSSIRSDVPQILINRESLSHITCDIELLGDCDVIVDHLCSVLGAPFSSLCDRRPLTQVGDEALRAGRSAAGAAASDSCSPATAGGQSEGAGEQAVAPDPSSEHDTAALRSCWQRKEHVNISTLLPEGSFLHRPPSRYIFPGAEVYWDADDLHTELHSSSSSSCSSSDQSDVVMATDDHVTTPATQLDPSAETNTETHCSTMASHQCAYTEQQQQQQQQQEEQEE